MDALIELSDENADWKLSFDEFLNCLKPGFNPPEKSESLSCFCLHQHGVYKRFNHLNNDNVDESRFVSSVIKAMVVFYA